MQAKQEKKDNKKIEFEKLKKQSEEYLHGWKRAMADYKNLKKQSEKEKDEFIKFANTNLIMSLIPVYNNLKLALEHSPNNDWSQGISHIQKQFKQVLEHNGIEEIIPEIDSKFNPQEHEAVESENKEESSVKSNDASKISKMVSCGYKLNNKIFIPAKVVVK